MVASSAKRRFTDPMVERLNAPKTGRAEYADAVCPGLVLRVTERGVKSFSVIYKVRGEGGVSRNGELLCGKQHRVTLGRWPILKLPEARESARDIVSAATGGVDKRTDRREQNVIRHANTFELVIDRYIEQHAKRHLKNWKLVESAFAMHVEPSWGKLPIHDIRRGDVHELLDAIVEKGRIGTAREVRKYLSSLFNWAVDREIVTASPVHALKREELAKNLEAGRTLTDHELRAVWQGAGELGYPLGPMYRLLILTGQRRGDWAAARRSELKPESELASKAVREAEGARERYALEIPAARYKGQRDHIVPLCDHAWAIVAALPEWKGNDYSLFSTRAGKVPVAGFSKGKASLDQQALAVLRKASGDDNAGLARYRIHDFRVTCESRLADLGFVQEVRDAVLGHAKVGLQKIYNKHDYFEEKRAALAAYAEHVMKVVG